MPSKECAAHAARPAPTHLHSIRRSADEIHPSLLHLKQQRGGLLAVRQLIARANSEAVVKLERKDA